MLPALTEIIAGLTALQLAPDTTAAVLGAVLAPLLRTTEIPQAGLELPSKPSRRSRVRSRLRAQGASRKQKYRRRLAVRPSEARERARAVLKANPDATLARVAKLAKCSPSTAVNARKEIEKETRKAARKAARETPKTAKPAPTDRRQRAQHFLREQLARGAKQVSDVEDAAAKAHVDLTALDQARAELGVVTSRANTGGAHAVQWSLPC